KTLNNGIKVIIDNPYIADLFFEATSAKAHLEHTKILKDLGKMVIDLTPAAVGPFFSPAVRETDTDKEYGNVNMITCGGQATIPIVHAVNEAADVTYAEIVATTEIGRA